MGLLVVSLLTQLFTGLASVVWIAMFVTEYKYAIQEGSGRNLSKAFWLIYSFAAILVLGCLMAVRSLIGLGTLISLSCVLAAVAAIWQYTKFKHWIFLVEFLAIICYILGLILQVALNDCGSDEAYKNCFKNCVLPNPEKFNNNALFHVLALVFVILYGFCKMILLRSSLDLVQDD